jgi:flagellar biosynthesis/type III secretory pathway protein FliH
VLQPLVAGPDAIPVIVDEQAAREDPELAVLSAMAHGRNMEVGPAIARAVMSAARGLDDERCSFYVDLAMSSLNEAARRTLEELMKSGKYEYQSEFARKYVAQGLEKGRQEGRQEGIQEGELRALLEVLDSRGLTVDADSRQRILACTDPAQLKRWLRMVAKVESVHELFGSSPA